jgi:PadR family transcriptional regulator PadR
MTDLTLNETVVLLAVHRLKEKAYGVAVKDEMEKITGGTVSYGTLYSYLDQLFRKGFLARHDGEPTPERGGRRKIYNRITSKGLKALKEAYEIQKNLVNEIGMWIEEIS